MKIALHLTLQAHVPGLRGDGELSRRALLEATRDVYLPLLRALDDLSEVLGGAQGPSLSLSVSPALVSALGEEARRARLGAALEGERRRRAEAVSRLEGDPLEEVASFYLRRAEALEADWGRYGQDLWGALRGHARAGRVALLPGVPGEAPLPLLATQEARRAALRAARRWADQQELPWGALWLPGCAWSPELRGLLSAEGVTSAVLGSQSWRGAAARPARGPWGPLREGGVTWFARHPEAEAPLRWPTQEPSWQRDLAAGEALRGWRRGQEARSGEGLLRLAQGEEARVYEPARAAAQAKQKAALWLGALRAQALAAAERLELERPSICAAWPAELFGVGWFEGPIFLKEALRLAAEDAEIALVAHSAEAAQARRVQRATPGAGSWHEGTFAAWVDPSTAWLQGAARQLERELVGAVAARGDKVRGAPTTSGASRQDRAAGLALLGLLGLQGEEVPMLRGDDGLADEAAAQVEGRLRQVRGLVDALHGDGRLDALDAETDRVGAALSALFRARDLLDQG
jgi:predicted glycosyl hydrolase (DUF1957 family)